MDGGSARVGTAPPAWPGSEKGSSAPYSFGFGGIEKVEVSECEGTRTHFGQGNKTLFTLFFSPSGRDGA